MTSDPYTLLAEFLHEKRASRFAWGTNDCCLFAADWLVALGKPDLMADFRGKYSDARGAIALWRPVEGYAQEGATRLAAGLTPVEDPARLARRGDIALVRYSAHHKSFGIVECGGVWGLTPHGLMRAPLSHVCNAWRSI
jgi:hypothetical protein